MKINRVLNIEDDIYKHIAICRALDYCRITNVDHAKNAEDGIQMLQTAIEAGSAYDLLVLDMQFPVKGNYHEEAGLYVMEQLKELGIQIPIIICSSVRLDIEGVVDCLHYSELRDLDIDMWAAVQMMLNHYI